MDYTLLIVTKKNAYIFVYIVFTRYNVSGALPGQFYIVFFPELTEVSLPASYSVPYMPQTIPYRNTSPHITFQQCLR
uniref:Uncharacterized protein n=1 Tax=Anguilla anguilla TaxID=7936 RepID=A0A0E9SEL6_ANGAN